MRVEKGKGKWVRILFIIICAATGLKKGGETRNSSHLKKGNIGMANMHKKQRRQDKDGLVTMAR